MKMNYSLTRESLRGHKMDSTILDEFYQERKNRSMSVKQHNLLKKNISFFNLG